jgi:succinate dehydrogenase/fumarate reductase flavoprotein subunit
VLCRYFVTCQQETLAEGAQKVDAIVESLNDVGLKDRSMIWNTDLVEVRRCYFYFPGFPF